MNREEKFIAQQILKLKYANAAYMAALEFDYCPDSKKVIDVMKLMETGLPKKGLKEALDEYKGSRPDEIANTISRLIMEL